MTCSLQPAASCDLVRAGLPGSCSRPLPINARAPARCTCLQPVHAALRAGQLCSPAREDTALPVGTQAATAGASWCTSRSLASLRTYWAGVGQAQTHTQQVSKHKHVHTHKQRASHAKARTCSSTLSRSPSCTFCGTGSGTCASGGVSLGAPLPSGPAAGSPSAAVTAGAAAAPSAAGEPAPAAAKGSAAREGTAGFSAWGPHPDTRLGALTYLKIILMHAWVH